jgi:hypothetical protein
MHAIAIERVNGKKAQASPLVEINIQIERWPIERPFPRRRKKRNGCVP